LLVGVMLAMVACDASDRDATDLLPGDTAPAASARDTAAVAADTAPASGFRREHSVDLTGDGRNETVIASAVGPAPDSLDVAITIIGARRDTLWHESWPSLLYFKYDPIEGKPDTAVSRIVREHLERLVAPDRFTMSGGLPADLRRGGDAAALMREAARYHLAELDYRTRADLTPADALEPRSHERIDAASVSADRVNVVVEELRSKPSFTYFAGGEATYVIAWSEREHAFVRIFSCC
jgi:hypothetical protein